uniref:Uncharacterized protein n=2 Tax=Spironucleus salmonicida TaxID=348837 RepID=V6LHA0_9EUKA|eukprot:EST43922.1 Hypothetical protein SS50377_16224 [Spironucleus salmonicida]
MIKLKIQNVCYLEDEEDSFNISIKITYKNKQGLVCYYTKSTALRENQQLVYQSQYTKSYSLVINIDNTQFYLNVDNTLEQKSYSIKLKKVQFTIVAFYQQQPVKSQFILSKLEYLAQNNILVCTDQFKSFNFNHSPKIFTKVIIYNFICFSSCAHQILVTDLEYGVYKVKQIQLEVIFEIQDRQTGSKQQNQIDLSEFIDSNQQVSIKKSLQFIQAQNQIVEVLNHTTNINNSQIIVGNNESFPDVAKNIITHKQFEENIQQLQISNEGINTVQRIDQQDTLEINDFSQIQHQTTKNQLARNLELPLQEIYQNDDKNLIQQNLNLSNDKGKPLLFKKNDMHTNNANNNQEFNVSLQVVQPVCPQFDSKQTQILKISDQIVLSTINMNDVNSSFQIQQLPNVDKKQLQSKNSIIEDPKQNEMQQPLYTKNITEQQSISLVSQSPLKLIMSPIETRKSCCSVMEQFDELNNSPQIFEKVRCENQFQSLIAQQVDELPHIQQKQKSLVDFSQYQALQYKTRRVQLCKITREFDKPVTSLDSITINQYGKQKIKYKIKQHALNITDQALLKAKDLVVMKNSKQQKYQQ